MLRAAARVAVVGSGAARRVRGWYSGEGLGLMVGGRGEEFEMARVRGRTVGERVWDGQRRRDHEDKERKGLQVNKIARRFGGTIGRLGGEE